MGYPTSDPIASSGGVRQVFQRGTIWLPQSGAARVVTGLLRDAWARSGYEAGPLGYPGETGDTLPGATRLGPTRA